MGIVSLKVGPFHLDHLITDVLGNPTIQVIKIIDKKEKNKIEICINSYFYFI